MSRLLRADLTPTIAWSEIETLPVVARIDVEMPQFWGGTQTVEQVLCARDEEFVLFNRWAGNKRITRVRFERPLNGSEMRLVEARTDPTSVYRLMLSPLRDESVSYVVCHSTWFGLWRNEPAMNLGGGICFIDSPEREELKRLRLQLLGGKIPDSLRVEEEMWERMNNMSNADRRAAMAALAMQSLAQIDRRFDEQFPDAGPVPDELQPISNHLQKQIREIEQAAKSRPDDPELKKLMQQFVRNAMNQGSSRDPS